MWNVIMECPKSVWIILDKKRSLDHQHKGFLSVFSHSLVREILGIINPAHYYEEESQIIKPIRLMQSFRPWCFFEDKSLLITFKS